MSRNLRTPSSRPPLKPSTGPSNPRTPVPPTPTKSRVQPTRSGTPTRPSAQAPVPTHDSAPAPLSIKEAIALRRAEVRKAQLKSNVQEELVSLEDASPVAVPKQEEEDILGRLPVRETIERARSTGTVNLATRSLPCIPSALFEIHLGITPDPLKSVPHEPVLPPSDINRRGKRENPAWYEAQDLQALKLWNNDIEEIQHEISLFGSLRTVDLHKNKLVSLPSTFADLTQLTTLDLSHNRLTTLPINLFALPELLNLNISHNSLSELPFNSPFSSSSGARKQPMAGNFFAPTIARASSPLPRLVILDASHNKITANAVDFHIPKTLTKFDLSGNPLASDVQQCRALLKVIANLPKLTELRLKGAALEDDIFPSNLFTSDSFPSIRILDMEETKVTPGVAKESLSVIKQRLEFDLITEDPPEGVACIIVGKRIVKEAWEIELERNEKTRKIPQVGFDDWDAQSGPRRPASSAGTRASGPPKVPQAVRSESPREVVKESWELEAEQGLLTESGRRRARAAASTTTGSAKEPQLEASSPIDSPTNTNLTSSLASPQYYTQLTQTLTLPPSAPPSKIPPHSRAFSVNISSSKAASSARSIDLAVPAPTLPLSTIVLQPFAHSLTTLILVNRRLDKSFALPSDCHRHLLPMLEELDLEGCSLADLVPVSRVDDNIGTAAPPRSAEKILPLIARLFPSLQTLNLSGNALTSAAFPAEALSEIILATPERKGLKHLRIRGNKILELEGFQTLAESFKGNRQVPGWRLDELDIRDNEIGKLPPELGLLPLDVFLVDGNIFRVPPRRIWEREGTKGLLSWLRGRIE